ncbi:hypothetical protein RFI_19025 [Reticulomyxa filosa]|uniref:Uncharacterized protein n=1 Tax=Reticulomyxa filosa TaxID=46433 RepID=X6MX98_RETFI|nr:hypothetical protein RFI_19025 [Reticulomyxa filosa]|eukprot:ETO18256.1 hypothetical protein RFI_19025 [Reticulomyxa filosa]
MNIFLQYVTKLKECFDLESKEGTNVRSAVGNNTITSHERLLLFQKGLIQTKKKNTSQNKIKKIFFKKKKGEYTNFLGYVSAVLPKPGFVALTDRQAVFHGRSVMTKTFACKLEDIAAIECCKSKGFIQRDATIVSYFYCCCCCCFQSLSHAHARQIMYAMLLFVNDPLRGKRKTRGVCVCVEINT